VFHLRAEEGDRKEEEAGRRVLLFHDGVPPDHWRKSAMNKKSGSDALVLEAMTFGKNCRRCGVYFVTRKKIEDLCPWCIRVETGENLEGVTERVDDLVFAGL
jgi:hypothetical protein